MSHINPYCVRNAIFETFIRPAIGPSRCRTTQNLLPRRTFIVSTPCHQKLSRKQREQTGATLTQEDQSRIRKAHEKAERRKAEKALSPRRGTRAQALLESLNLNKDKRGRELPKAAVEEEVKPLENDEIMDLEISLVDRDERFHRRVNTKEVLWGLNRAEEKLVVVKTARKGDARSMTVCKIYALEQLVEKERRRKSTAAVRDKGEKMAKELGMNWTVGPADLELKCKQMIKFLGEGRKVDVTVTRKFKKRVPDMTNDELQSVLDRIRDTAMGVKGTREYTEPIGQLAHTMLMHFEGPNGGLKEEMEGVGAEGLPGPEIATAAAS
jgi:translation initiation factor IF-3